MSATENVVLHTSSHKPCVQAKLKRDTSSLVQSQSIQTNIHHHRDVPICKVNSSNKVWDFIFNPIRNLKIISTGDYLKSVHLLGWSEIQDSRIRVPKAPLWQTGLASDVQWPHSNYKAHLWARLLGASDFVGTAIKVPNGDIHSPNQKCHLCIHPDYKPWCKWPFSPSSIPRYSGCSIAIPQGLLFASSLMDEEKNIKELRVPWSCGLVCWNRVKLWTAASEVPGKIQRTYIEKNHFTLSVATSMRFIAACICIGQPVLVITRYVSIDKSESSCASRLHYLVTMLFSSVRHYSLGNVAWALGYPALVTDIMFIMSAGLLDICRRRISSK
ncbi:hypothetical protein C8J56DRAFT_896327 [Mycena floridula]|nr:hypothetical protein C8J56DRAFT_896327 [Mycena floridula]